jgi:hypothetical protein
MMGKRRLEVKHNVPYKKSYDNKSNER